MSPYLASFSVLLLLVVQDSFCRPRSRSTTPRTEILYHKNSRSENKYEFEYVAEDGTRRQETGTLIYKENSTDPVLHVKGSYEYLLNGKKIVVNYEADEKGMRQEGDTLPQSEAEKNDTNPKNRRNFSRSSS